MKIHLPEGDFTPTPGSNVGCGPAGYLISVVLILICLNSVVEAILFLINAWILRPLGQELLKFGGFGTLFSMDESRIEITIVCLMILFWFVVLPTWLFVKFGRDK